MQNVFCMSFAARWKNAFFFVCRPFSAILVTCLLKTICLSTGLNVFHLNVSHNSTKNERRSQTNSACKLQPESPKTPIGPSGRNKSKSQHIQSTQRTVWLASSHTHFAKGLLSLDVPKYKKNFPHEKSAQANLVSAGCYFSAGSRLLSFHR